MSEEFPQSSVPLTPQADRAALLIQRSFRRRSTVTSSSSQIDSTDTLSTAAAGADAQRAALLIQRSFRRSIVNSQPPSPMIPEDSCIIDDCENDSVDEKKRTGALIGTGLVVGGIGGVAASAAVSSSGRKSVTFGENMSEVSEVEEITDFPLYEASAVECVPGVAEATDHSITDEEETERFSDEDELGESDIEEGDGEEKKEEKRSGKKLWGIAAAAGLFIGAGVVAASMSGGPIDEDDIIAIAAHTSAGTGATGGGGAAGGTATSGGTGAATTSFSAGGTSGGAGAGAAGAGAAGVSSAQ